MSKEQVAKSKGRSKFLIFAHCYLIIALWDMKAAIGTVWVLVGLQT
jgi:hypothetical protein